MPQTPLLTPSVSDFGLSVRLNAGATHVSESRVRCRQAARRPAPAPAAPNNSKLPRGRRAPPPALDTLTPPLPPAAPRRAR